MIREKDIKKIKKVVQKYFVGASSCHDWSHVERVCVLALKIGETEEGVDFAILKVASYLHDIGRKAEMDNGMLENKIKLDHAIEGAKMAKEILKQFKNITLEETKNIIHCIEAHRWRNENTPKTIEARILFDADKLDSIGAIGVARDFLFAGMIKDCVLYTGQEDLLANTGRNYTYQKKDSALLEYEVKLKKIKDKISTKSGQKFAQERHKFMVEFFDRFKKEIKGVL